MSVNTSIQFDKLKHTIGGQPLVISKSLTVQNPSIRDITDFGEEKYLNLVTLTVARPYDFMVQLDDAGINYLDVDDFEFFSVNLNNLPQEITRILFGDIDFTGFEFGENVENGELIFCHPNNKIIIDRLVFAQITKFVREMNVISDEIEFKAGNERMRKSLIDRNRRKQKKEAGKTFESQLSNLISLAVNHEGFKYNYDTVLDLRISQFYDAYYRLNKIENYRQTMSGVYAGTISFEKLDKSHLSWAGNLVISQRDIDKSKLQLERTM